ncbi:Endomembrane protein [Gracilaria domingensis]|nr:Endomembrane protein [Gracilaria domingensis]
MKDYSAGDPVEVLANRLTSPTSTLPFPYYSIPVCKPKRRVRSRAVNLGQILLGERAFPTAFNISMMDNVKCVHMCTISLSKVSSRLFKNLVARISENYSARLHTDNMPLITRYLTNTGRSTFRFGYPLGFTSGEKVYINNHLSLKILYHRPSLEAGEAFDALTASEKFRIVGFEVHPSSMVQKLGRDGSMKSCRSPQDASPMQIKDDSDIHFTYDVQFEESEIAWATRWDTLLNVTTEIKEIQWYSIANSLMVSLFLSAVVATVMLRTVLKDFGRYNAIIEEDEEIDMTGWKYIHGDVFRPPKYATLLSICVGTGAQIFVMAALTQAFALIGFLSPANRGGLLTALLTMWVLASSVSGYVTARIYSALDTGVSRRVVTFGTALLFPGITFGIFFGLNLVMWTVGSSGSVPFMTLLVLLFMWFGISVPLAFVGAYAGYRRKTLEFPTRTNQIRRQIPPPPLGLSPFVYSAMAGILPFGTVFMELVFVLNSVSSDSVYYLYGALVAVFVILVITCAELSIVSTYLSLSAEDWKSHWHTSFVGCASSGLYVFLYSLYYAQSQPHSHRVPFVSRIVYMCWSLVMSGAFGLMCGAIGFLSSLWFTRKIYASIRID